MAKLLMSHTFFVKFPGFKQKRTIQHIGFIFSDEANFVKFFQYSEQAIL